MNKMIKKINQNSVEDIIKLHKKAIFPLWDKLGRKYSVEGIRDFVLEVFQKGEVFGLVDKKGLEGVIGVEIESNTLEIGFLLVNPKNQGKGYGKELMNFVENQYAKQVSKAQLDVLIKNPAVGFYERLGYKIIRINNKKQKYIMEKKL